MPYGSWIKPDRFLNFQELLPFYYDRLKEYLFTLEDKYNGFNITRVVKATGEHGYTIQVKDIKKVIEDLTCMSFVQRGYQVGTFAVGSSTQTIELGGEVRPGTVVVKSKDFTIVDTQDGRLVGVDKSRKYEGSIDYTTGTVKITLDFAIDEAGANYIAAFGGASTVKLAAYTPEKAATGVTYFKVENAIIPNASGAYGMTILIDDASDKFYVGITTPTVEGTPVPEVSTEQDIIDAINDPETTQVRLAQDISFETPLTVGKEGFTIDGAGHTITVPVTSTAAGSKDGILVSNTNGVVIKDANIVVDIADKMDWNGHYGIQIYEGNATISNVKVSGANAGIIINGGTATLTGTIDLSDNGFGGMEVSKGGNEGATVPSVDATDAAFINTTETYGTNPTVWIDKVTEIGTECFKAPASMTSVYYSENGKDQQQFYVDPAHAQG